MSLLTALFCFGLKDDELAKVRDRRMNETSELIFTPRGPRYLYLEVFGLQVDVKAVKLV